MLWSRLLIVTPALLVTLAMGITGVFMALDKMDAWLIFVNKIFGIKENHKIED